MILKPVFIPNNWSLARTTILMLNLQHCPITISFKPPLCVLIKQWVKTDKRFIFLCWIFKSWRLYQTLKIMARNKLWVWAITVDFKYNVRLNIFHFNKKKGWPTYSRILTTKRLTALIFKTFQQMSLKEIHN